MIKTTNTNTTNNGKCPVSCEHCLHAALHRYGNNPLLAQCLRKPQPMNDRFPYEVEVARVLRHCFMYQEDKQVKVIEQREIAVAS